MAKKNKEDVTAAEAVESNPGVDVISLQEKLEQLRAENEQLRKRNEELAQKTVSQPAGSPDEQLIRAKVARGLTREQAEAAVRNQRRFEQLRKNRKRG